MLKSVEDINTTKKRLRIEIPSDVIEGEIRDSLEKLRTQAKIPGFRPGKAPVSLIEKRFGKEVEGEVLERIIPAELGSAIKEAALSPITMPVLEDEFQFTRNNPVALSVIVEVVPEIGNLEYDGIEVKDLVTDVEESDLEESLKRIREQKAVYEVADKEIEMDDFVSFEYADSEIEGGEDIPGAKAAIKKMGNEIFPPDLMERVIGKKKGDIVEFSTTFDEIKSKELAGRTVKIKVMISEVKRKNLPSMDDEFAKDLGFENVAELKEKLTEKIRAAKQDQAKKIQKAQIVNKLLESQSFEVPEVLLQRELDVLMMQQSTDAKEQGDDSSVENSKAVTGSDDPDQKVEEDPETKLRERALRNVRAALIIDAIGRKEGVVVSEKEVDDRVSLMAQRLSTTPENIRSFYQYRGGGSMESLKQSLYEEKVLDILLSKAAVEKAHKGE